MDVSDLTPLEQTAFLTLYARALDSRWPRPILGDKLADNVVANIDYDFAAMGVTSSVVCQSALRAKMLDDRVRKYVAEHPDAVVVDLGAGLDDGMYRVNPPPDVCLVQRRLARRHRGGTRCSPVVTRPTRSRRRWRTRSGRTRSRPTDRPCWSPTACLPFSANR